MERKKSGEKGKEEENNDLSSSLTSSLGFTGLGLSSLSGRFSLLARRLGSLSGRLSLLAGGLSKFASGNSSLRGSEERSTGLKERSASLLSSLVGCFEGDFCLPQGERILSQVSIQGHLGPVSGHDSSFLGLLLQFLGLAIVSILLGLHLSKSGFDFVLGSWKKRMLEKKRKRERKRKKRTFEGSFSDLVRGFSVLGSLFLGNSIVLSSNGIRFSGLGLVLTGNRISFPSLGFVLSGNSLVLTGNRSGLGGFGRSFFSLGFGLRSNGIGLSSDRLLQESSCLGISLGRGIEGILDSLEFVLSLGDLGGVISLVINDIRKKRKEKKRKEKKRKEKKKKEKKRNKKKKKKEKSRKPEERSPTCSRKHHI